MKIFSYIILFAVISTRLASQVDDSKVNPFFIDALSFYSKDSSKPRIDFYIQIPLSSLQLKRVKNDFKNYSSELDLIIDISDKNGSRVFNQLYKETVSSQKTEVEFLNTNSFITTKNIFIQPGNYKVKAVINEFNSKKTFVKEQEITIPDYPIKQISISDVMIISKINEQGGKKFITPCVSRNISDLDTFNILFYVYKNVSESPLKVIINVINSKNEASFSSEKIIDDLNSFTGNQFLIPIPSNKLMFDNFTISISGSTQSYNDKKIVTLVNESSEIPSGLGGIDELISQMIYIAKEEDLDFIKAGKTENERTQRYIDYWAAKDPNPITRKNEIMVEYYKRVRYSNEKYSTVYTKGWRTDMGMVYIIYGLPSSIERHPFEGDTKPYEIWTYDQFNRQYIFVDETGFGDYRLTTPIWDTFRFNR